MTGCWITAAPMLISLLIPPAPASHRVGYDPDAALLDQAEPSIKANVTLYSDRRELLRGYAGHFTLIACVEVCEHLTPNALDELFTTLRALAAPGARVLIGVPIETGLSGFMKNLYRISQGGRQGADIRRAIRTLAGLPIERKPDRPGWYGSHIGFDHRVFRALLPQHGLRVTQTTCLPFPLLGEVVNNEIYHLCER
jgi:hypothetical protein